MRKVVGWLTVVYRVLLVGLVPALYLSYFPVIRLGGDATMNFELSVAEIWLVALDVVGVLVLAMRGEMVSVLRRWCRRRWMWVFFPLMVTASAVWSFNATRGWLTVAMMWVVIAAAIVIWELRGVMDEKWRHRWWWGLVGGTLVACAWCVAQCVMDVAGVGREVTGMCAGCVSQMFGFPHPNGWAIEPQFMGNLLLAPALIMAAVLISEQGIFSLAGLEFSARHTLDSRQNRPMGEPVGAVRNIRGENSNQSFMLKKKALARLSTAAVFMVVAATIFLTFSRGAIYAFVLAVGVLGIYYIVRRKAWKGVMMMWGMVVVAFAVVLNLQGLMAEVGPTNDTYGTAVAKAINHLTLGVVDVRGNEAKDGEIEAGSEETEKTDSSPSPSGAINEAIFDGYVTESTETRVRLTEAALTVWRSNPAITMAGVGIGGAGVALYEARLTPTPKEIVQNEYTSLLLETGVVGVVLAVVMMGPMVVMLVRRRAVVVLILMGAYGVTLMFFSGLPNALQIYTMPVLVLAMIDYSDKRKKLVS